MINEFHSYLCFLTNQINGVGHVVSSKPKLFLFYSLLFEVTEVVKIFTYKSNTNTRSLLITG